MQDLFISISKFTQFYRIMLWKLLLQPR